MVGAEAPASMSPWTPFGAATPLPEPVVGDRPRAPPLEPAVTPVVVLSPEPATEPRATRRDDGSTCASFRNDAIGVMVSAPRASERRVGDTPTGPDDLRSDADLPARLTTRLSVPVPALTTPSINAGATLLMGFGTPELEPAMDEPTPPRAIAGEGAGGLLWAGTDPELSFIPAFPSPSLSFSIIVVILVLLSAAARTAPRSSC